MNNNERLKGLKILVTAGPTPVKVDDVRILTNVFSGTTGYRIAVLAAEKGADIVLLLGPHHIENSDMLADESYLNIAKKTAEILQSKARIDSSGGVIRIERYSHFEDLMALVEKQAGSREFDAVVHSAAVADYAPAARKGKIKSNLGELALDLKPTPKIIKRIKILDPEIFQVQFKLEVGLSENDLIESAYQSLLKNKSDLVVANNMAGTSEITAAAYIIDQRKNIKKIATRETMYESLLKEIRERLEGVNK